MRRSDTIAELAKALAAAQGEFQAVPRENENPFFHSMYADLPSVVMAASPILSKHGLSVSQLPDFDGTNDLLTTTIMHSSGEWLEASARLHLLKDEPQAQGSATTYMRRYAYSGGVGIVTEVDDDAEAASGRGAGRPTPHAAPQQAEDGAPSCPSCGSALRERKGAKGPFVGCSTYPACRFTANGTLEDYLERLHGDIDPEEINPPSTPPPAATGDLTAQVIALAKEAGPEATLNAFKTAGAVGCLSMGADGKYRLRRSELDKLSESDKEEIIRVLDIAF